MDRLGHKAKVKELPKDWNLIPAIPADRVCLKTLREEMVQPIFEEFSENITRYMLPKAPQDPGETLAFIRLSRRGMTERRELVCAVFHRGTGEFLGCCGLHARPAWEWPELGIWIKESAHGFGYGREAVRTMASWAFRNLDIPLLIYPVDRDNHPSRKIPESLGGVVFAEKVVPTQRGTFLDEVVYRIPPFPFD